MTNPSVFSDRERTRQGPRKAGESLFSYLDSSAREEADAARKVIDEWLTDYPEEAFDHWSGDFKSQDDDQHESAFFELFLFQFFRRSGCDVLAVEPEVEGQKGKPDFLVRDRGGREFFVEAIAPSFRPDVSKRSEKLIADIKNAINCLKIENYFLVLDKIEAPAQAINKKRLVEALSEWIEKQPDESDVFKYEDNGALVHIKVIPRKGREVDSPDYRAIALEMEGVSVSTPGEDIRRGLVKKASKYKDLNAPYVVALNARSMHDTEDDYLAATYGTSAVVISIGPDGAEHGEPRMIRNPDGLFNEGRRPRKKNVSAVLLFNGVKPWQWADRFSVVIHNAYASHPLGDETFGGHGFVIDGDHLKKIEGNGVAEIFSS